MHIFIACKTGIQWNSASADSSAKAASDVKLAIRASAKSFNASAAAAQAAADASKAAEDYSKAFDEASAAADSWALAIANAFAHAG